MTFISNKYRKWYFELIKKAKNRSFDSISNNFIEIHHIVPKSLGGTNDKDNLVKLTIKEHVVCHMLLVKITEGIDKFKMQKALASFGKRKRVKYTLVELCEIRKANHAPVPEEIRNIIAEASRQTFAARDKEKEQARLEKIKNTKAKKSKKEIAIIKDKLSQHSKLVHKLRTPEQKAAIAEKIRQSLAKTRARKKLSQIISPQ